MTKSDRAQVVRDGWWKMSEDDAEIISERAIRTARSDRERRALYDLIDAQRKARARRDRDEVSP
jgi:F0F1-type ATP synthase epsilon subunit